MKVFLDPPHPSLALKRVANALTAHAPSNVEITSSYKAADFIIFHAIGRLNSLKAKINSLLKEKKQYAIIQYALRSTKEPRTQSWISVWSGAKVVWSYYDLPALISQDHSGWSLIPEIPVFYHAPLGVDSTVFFGSGSVKKEYIILTSGGSWLTEGVREAVHAARRVGGKVAHLGKELGRGEGVHCYNGVGDSTLAYLYRRSRFVCGLRRKEGFELPAAEGLLCRATPILFDQPHYKQWYGSWAEYIPEGPRNEVIDSLEALFRRDTVAIDADQRRKAVELFDWGKIAIGFWEKCLS